MSRWVWFSICVIGAVVMLVCGLQVPLHLRAVEVSVLQKAGEKTTSLVDQGLILIRADKLGAAQLLSQAAQRCQLAGVEKLDHDVNDLARQHPGWVVWGGPEPRFESIYDSNLQNPGFDPFTEYVVRLENRERVLAMLATSRRPVVQ